MAAVPFLMVCEKTGQWAAAIRWQQKARSFPLRECRSLIDARNQLLESPDTIIALEITLQNAEGVLRLIFDARQHRPNVVVIALLTTETQRLAEIFRESGAKLVVLSMRRLDRLCKFVERCLESREPADLPTRDRIWARLPWDEESLRTE